MRASCGAACLASVRVAESSGSMRSREEPVDRLVTSWWSVAIQESTAVVSVLSGISLAAVESRARMEKRASGRALRIASRSARAPSSRVPEPPAQSSAAIEPVRSTTR